MSLPGTALQQQHMLVSSQTCHYPQWIQEGSKCCFKDETVVVYRANSSQLKPMHQGLLMQTCVGPVQASRAVTGGPATVMHTCYLGPKGSMVEVATAMARSAKVSFPSTNSPPLVCRLVHSS